MIAWGGGYLTESGIDSFLKDPATYRHLPAQSGQRRLSPSVIIQFSGVGAGDDVLLIHPSSSSRLIPHIEDKALQLGIPVTQDNPGSLPINFHPKLSAVHWLYFTWAGGIPPLTEDTLDKIQSEKLADAGEILSDLLIQLVRQSTY
jgi:hypothetical protein